MRDYKRIQITIALLQRGWEKVPDWRLGQLIENLKRYVGVEDLFYIEDDILTDKIVEFFGLNEDKYGDV